MKIAFKLIGEGEQPPPVDWPAVPHGGDLVEFRGVEYVVKRARFRIEPPEPRIVIEIERA